MFDQLSAEILASLIKGSPRTTRTTKQNVDPAVHLSALTYGLFIWSEDSLSSARRHMCCSSTQDDSLPSACLRGLARHFKTEPTETVALCFGYPKTPCLRAEGKLSSSIDEQHKRCLRISKTEIYGLSRICFEMTRLAINSLQ
jgi:hypothetical protein